MHSQHGSMQWMMMRMMNRFHVIVSLGIALKVMSGMGITARVGCCRQASPGVQHITLQIGRAHV